MQSEISSHKRTNTDQFTYTQSIRQIHKEMKMNGG